MELYILLKKITLNNLFINFINIINMEQKLNCQYIFLKHLYIYYILFYIQNLYATYTVMLYSNNLTRL